MPARGAGSDALETTGSGESSAGAAGGISTGARIVGGGEGTLETLELRDEAAAVAPSGG